FTAAGANAPAPWNNVTGLNANTVVANLRDNNNAATNMSMTLQTVWQGTNANGYTTGNNSGLYPDNVMRTSYYMENSTPRTVLMSGLNPAKAYDFTFFASRTGVADQRNTNYTIGLKTVVLDAANNQSNTVKITNVRPNASGQVTVTMVRGSGNGTFGYIGSMVLREYEPSNTPTPPSAPANLAAVVTSRSAIRLTWVDGSEDETGFEIYRSVGNNTSYALLQTVAAGVTTLNNSGLTNGQTYYYKVRAVNAVGASEYTNESSGTTFNYSMSINFNSSGSSQSGWANLSAWNANDGWIPTNPTNVGPDGMKGAGLNIIDDVGTATGVSMTVVKAFGGTNPAGMNVSNGVVPANVMRQSWFVDKGTSSILKFGNLNLTKKYTFAFFGSRDDTNDPAPRITIYTIGSTSVSLDCSKNTQNLAIIRDVVPQSDGTITVTVSAPLASAYGYLNGLIIQALPNPNARIAADEDGAISSLESNEVQAFPNPFADRLTLKFAKGGHFQAKMLSINGIAAFQGEFDAEDEEEVELPVNADLAPGVYILNVIESKGASQTIKLLKK
ncbi:MAG TPA: fibronectin type III domain-containing protein, partial [Cyclobacteriaceae bacterium]|nr:fibronectin type III domain-containing protein [Cyclobacteriaceae bacterium]